MVNLEKKSIEIQNHMHDSVIHDFDRVSGYNDNGLTPLQGQQDEQPEAINSTEIAIENDAVDILTLYPSWSRDTNDKGDNNQVTCERNRKEIQDKLYKDTPAKTESNKPYIDNIDTVNSAENAIERDAVDILTGYPSWSKDTNDICDNNEVICNRNRKEKKYKINYTKTHQSRHKTISPI